MIQMASPAGNALRHVGRRLLADKRRSKRFGEFALAAPA